jgi:hypothetical protein
LYLCDWVVADIRKRDLQLAHVASISYDDFPEDVRPHLASIIGSLKEAYGNIMVSWLVSVVKIEC